MITELGSFATGTSSPVSTRSFLASTTCTSLKLNSTASSNHICTCVGAVPTTELGAGFALINFACAETVLKVNNPNSSATLMRNQTFISNSHYLVHLRFCAFAKIKRPPQQITQS